jgi:hypothetical protein
MKKVLGGFIILVSLPLLAWSIYVEFVFLGEAKGKYNTMMTTAAEKYSESTADTEKRYKDEKDTITRNYNEKVATLDGQTKITFENQFKETEKTFENAYISAVKIRDETYEQFKTQIENSFNERVSREREASYSMHSGILGLIFFGIGIFLILRGRKKATNS